MNSPFQIDLDTIVCLTPQTPIFFSPFSSYAIIFLMASKTMRTCESSFARQSGLKVRPPRRREIASSACGSLAKTNTENYR